MKKSLVGLIKWAALLIPISALFLLIGWATGYLNSMLDGFIVLVVIILFYVFILRKNQEI